MFDNHQLNYEENIFFSFFFIVDFVIPSKEQSLIEAFKKLRERADAKVCCDYGLHVAITHWDEQVAKDMETLSKEKGSIEEIYEKRCIQHRNAKNHQ